MTEPNEVEGANMGSTGVPTRDTQRDLAAAHGSLEPWFRRVTDSPDLVLGEVRTPSSSGVANETLMCDASWSEAGTPRSGSFVIRVSSPDFLYKDVDFAAHVEMCRALGKNPDVPVPRIVGEEADTSILGQAFYVMELIEGQVPEDSPPYHTGGWVADLAPAQRRELWEDAVRVMAALHETDLADVAFLDRPHLGATGLEQDVAAWTDYGAWAASGRSLPVVEASRDWLLATVPADPPTGLAWGDARIGNMIFKDNRVVAVLDWDMVSLAGAESDLAWWAIMEYLYTDSAGVPRLEGIGSPAETVAEWEHRAGRPVRDMEYQLVFAAYRMAVILVRLSDLLGAAGVLPADLAAEMVTNNSGIQYLATMLDLPHAGTIVTPWPGLGL